MPHFPKSYDELPDDFPTLVQTDDLFFVSEEFTHIPQTLVFCLGYEYRLITEAIDTTQGFSATIHIENRIRVLKLLELRRRKYVYSTPDSDGTWFKLRVKPLHINPDSPILSPPPPSPPPP